MKTVLSAKKCLLSDDDFKQIAGTRMAERMVSNKLMVRSERVLRSPFRRKLYLDIRTWCENQCSAAVYAHIPDDLNLPVNSIKFTIYFSSQREAAMFRVFWDGLDWGEE